MAHRVNDVTAAGKNSMLATAWLYPLEIDHLACKELRIRLLNLIVGIHCEHAERARRRSVAPE